MDIRGSSKDGDSSSRHGFSVKWLEVFRLRSHSGVSISSHYCCAVVVMLQALSILQYGERKYSVFFLLNVSDLSK